MFFVLFPRETEHAPNAGFSTSFGEKIRLGTRYGCGRRHTLVFVIHDAHRAVLRENNQVHTGKTLLGSNDKVTNLSGILQDFLS